MIPIDQPNQSQCLRACTASLLEVEIDEIPDFVSETEKDWFLEMQHFLAKRGLCFVHIHLHAKTPWMPLPHHPWAIFIGLSSKGVTHAVVGRCAGHEFAIIHDPHPKKRGIDLVESVNFLVPLDPANYQPEKRVILTSGIVPGGFRNGRL